MAESTMGVTTPPDNTKSDLAIVEQMSVFADLIGRLGTVTGPDRALDRAIFEAVCLEVQFDAHNAESWFCSIDGNSYGFNKKEGGVVWCGPLPRVTKYIDAALTLLPNFISSELTTSAAGKFTRARLWDWRRSPTMSDPGNEWKSDGDRPLAVNICIAALKARAASLPPVGRQPGKGE